MKHTRTIRAATLVGTIALGATAPPGAAASAAACRDLHVSWTSPSVGIYQSSSHLPTYDPGVSVPAPAAGETITIVSSAWVSYDRYLDGTVPTRADDNQQNERWGISIGGTSFGNLTDDVPDIVGQGAETPWFSGLRSGSFGTGPAGSGAIVLRHASLYGYTESANSIHPYSFDLTVRYCTADGETTTTAAPTTAAPTTAATPTTAAAPTTEPAPPSTALDPTTTAVEPAPQTTSGTTPSTDAATTVPPAEPGTTPDSTVAPGPTPAAPTVPTGPTTTVPPLDTRQTATTLSTSSTEIVPAGPTLPTTTTTAQSTATTAMATPRGTLPSTGARVLGLLRLAGILVSLGAALQVVRRRLIVA